MLTHRFFGLFVIVFLPISLILIKGSGYEGQANLFSNFLQHYTEETSAAIISPSQNQLADINSITFNDSLINKSSPRASTSILQQNSLLSYNSLENDMGALEGDSRTGIAFYTVQEGDTLSFIASDFGISINSLIWANNLRDVDSLKPGMELKIPPVSGIIHKVAKNDTVDKIAKKYGAEAKKILNFNGLPQDGSLQVGTEIIVPDGKISRPVYASAPIKRFQYLPNLDSYFSHPTGSIGFNWGRIHGRNGIDVASSCGTPIYATADGQVTISDGVGWNGGFGKFIKIIHPNGTETIYAHASRLLASLGEFVGKGQLIAFIGSTGRSTGCHVHFEVHGARNPLAR